MKRILFVLTAIVIGLSVSAQGNSGKGKNKDKDKTNNSPAVNPGNGNDKDKPKEDKVKNDEYDRKIWDGIDDGKGSCMKPSKNQPAKVRAAFQRDYPFATFVRWSKCRGDWTASFNNGLFRSTAVYHANGDRRDTRTFVQRESLPVKILDIIINRLPGVSVEGGIKIEVPNIVKDIFRIKNLVEGKPQYLYLDANGAEVQYNY
jgi:hypothetical protein